MSEKRVSPRRKRKFQGVFTQGGYGEETCDNYAAKAAASKFKVFQRGSFLTGLNIYETLGGSGRGDRRNS